MDAEFCFYFWTTIANAKWIYMQIYVFLPSHKLNNKKLDRMLNWGYSWLENLISSHICVTQLLKILICWLRLVVPLFYIWKSWVCIRKYHLVDSHLIMTTYLLDVAYSCCIDFCKMWTKKLLHEYNYVVNFFTGWVGA